MAEFLHKRYKDPDSVRRFTRDMSAFLAPGVVISSVAWTVRGPDSVLQISQPTADDTTTSCLVAGGTLGAEYELESKATLSNGEVEVLTCLFLIVDR